MRRRRCIPICPIPAIHYLVCSCSIMSTTRSNVQSPRGNAGSLFLHGGNWTDQQNRPHDNDHNSSVNSAASQRSTASGLREHNMRKFLGKWRKISGDEWHRCEITLRERGSSSDLFFKLNIEQEGHFAELDAYNLTKIHVRHSFGLATFTMDYSNKYLFEENHSNGTNWVFKWVPPEGSSTYSTSTSISRLDREEEN